MSKLVIVTVAWKRCWLTPGMSITGSGMPPSVTGRPVLSERVWKPLAVSWSAVAKRR